MLQFKNLSVFLVISLVIGILITMVMTFQYYYQIRDFPVSSWQKDHRADCGVVLTGGPNRIQDAVEQLYQKRIEKLIIAGVYPGTPLRDIFPGLPFYGSMDSDDIILERRSQTTYGNAQQALPLVEALNCKDVLLITSKLHMIRAYQTFRSHFPEEIPIYQRATVERNYRPGSSRVAFEAIKTVFYDFWLF